MKKILMLSVLVLGISVAAPAFAEKGDMQGGGRHGKGGGMFKKLDADADGFISRAEFDAMHEEMFKKMDVDGDGKVSKDEAKAHHEARREKWKEHKDKRQERRKERSED